MKLSIWFLIFLDVKIDCKNWWWCWVVMIVVIVLVLVMDVSFLFIVLVSWLKRLGGSVILLMLWFLRIWNLVNWFFYFGDSCINGMVLFCCFNFEIIWNFSCCCIWLVIKLGVVFVVWILDIVFRMMGKLWIEISLFSKSCRIFSNRLIGILLGINLFNILWLVLLCDWFVSWIIVFSNCCRVWSVIIFGKLCLIILSRCVVKILVGSMVVSLLIVVFCCCELLI